MEKKSFEFNNRQVTLYCSDMADRPLIVTHEFEGDGSGVLAELEKADAPDCNLLVVGGLDWDKDMSPWYCPPVFPNGEEYAGGADAFLSLLLEEILPRAKTMLNGTPEFTGIAGYSLAGLFSLYALYRCDAFDRAASMSGSLWYPDFEQYVRTHNFVKKPEKLYLSLGDKEAKTRNRYMRTVQECTERTAEYYKGLGLDVTWELNPGNHFKDPEKRCAKGILCLLKK